MSGDLRHVITITIQNEAAPSKGREELKGLKKALMDKMSKADGPKDKTGIPFVRNATEPG